MWIQEDRIKAVKRELESIQKQFDVMDDSTGHLAGDLYERQARLEDELRELQRETGTGKSECK